MTIYAFSRIPAFNPNTNPASVAKSATGSVYDLGDVGFLTPLNLTLVATNTVTTTLISDANGMFPDFTLVDRTQCAFESGTQVFVLTTTTPIPGPTGPTSTVPGPAGPATTDASLLAAGTVAEARLPSNLAATALNATYASIDSVVGPPLAAKVTQNLYSRSVPAPTGATLGVVALAKDPSVTGRIWVQGMDFGQLGYSDTNGDTWSSKGVPPAGTSAGVQELQFAGGYAWITQGPVAAKTGTVWRSPLPDSSGNGLVWTKVFDLASPPGAITTGDTATFRNACLAVNGANIYLVEYSTTAITGGPSCYYSADSGATWAKVKTWANAKHCHAVKVIGGLPWVMNGDSTFTDLGLWNANTVGAVTWAQRSLYGEALGGNTNYGINFFPITPTGGNPIIVSEYDGIRQFGPLIFPSQGTNVSKPLIPSSQISTVYAGRTAQLTYTSEGNLMWVQTGENNAIGPTDTVMIAKGPHFNQAIALETAAANTTFGGTLGNPVESGNYVWFGNQRIRKEKFIGQ